MAIVTAKFKPNQGGTEFEVRNIQDFSYSVQRNPGPNGQVGTRGFNIGTITLTRIKSLQQDGEAQREEETLRLAAGIDKKAYFTGEITVAPVDDESNIVMTIRWEEGHISGLRSNVSASDEFPITEQLEITVINLMVDDYEFKRVAA